MAIEADSINRSALQYNESIQSHIDTICEPLKYLGLTHFGYFRFYKDGTYLKLCNNSSWTKHYITNNLADKTTAFAESIISVPLFELNTQLWPKPKGDDCLAALFDHNVWHGIDLTIKHEDFIEVYYFATERDNNQIYDLYMNHLDLLKRFKAHFHDKIAGLVNFSEKQLLATQQNPISFFSEANPSSGPPSLYSQDKNIDAFLKETDVSHYYLSGKYSHIYLTRREAECLGYLSQGRTSKEIGKIMNLSSRTVESYITNLKVKTNTNWKSQLIDIYSQSHLPPICPFKI